MTRVPALTHGGMDSFKEARASTWSPLSDFALRSVNISVRKTCSFAMILLNQISLNTIVEFSFKNQLIVIEKNCRPKNAAKVSIYPPLLHVGGVVGLHSVGQKEGVYSPNVWKQRKRFLYHGSLA